MSTGEYVQSFLSATGGKKVVKKTTLCLLKYCWEKEGKKREKKHSFISSHVKPVKTLPCWSFCQQSAPRVFLLGFGVKNRLMILFFLFASFSPSKTATGINSIAAAKGKTPAAFNHKLGSVHTFF